MKINDIDNQVLNNFRDGVVIPALPLALDTNKKISKMHEKAIVKYYINSGVGGIAVGVHSTQFEIRDPNINLFQPILELCSNTIDSEVKKTGKKILKIAGVSGTTKQSIKEAKLAKSIGYNALLVSLKQFKDDPLDALIQHCEEIAKIMPIIGFYLQPAVGGRILPYEFWLKFANIKNVLGVKTAPFNRYYTLEVIRGIMDAGKENDITIYTGNDDNIIIDLLTKFKIKSNGKYKELFIRGGLLGHWGVWTKKAVEILNTIKENRVKENIPTNLITLASQITDMNSAVFDTANNYAGVIPGIHEILRRNKLMQSTLCLDENLKLSNGQSKEIDRVIDSYPELCDSKYISENINDWLNEN